MKRGELIERLENLKKKRKEVFNEAENFKSKFYNLQSKYQPEIDELSEKADLLAEEFKSLYRQSQEAYIEGDGAGAKSLANRGRMVQNQCESLNEKANSMRDELKSLYKRKEEKYEKVKEIGRKIDNLKSKLESGFVKQTKVQGFRSDSGITHQEVEKFLDKFPQVLFKPIESIRFVNRWESYKGDAIGGSLDDSERNKYEIKIYRHEGRETGREDLERDIKETISHEIGEIIYKEVLTPETRQDWIDWYKNDLKEENFITDYAVKNPRDNFCECFMNFFIKPKVLEKFDEHRYDKIKTLLGYLEKSE